jgi:hypothetical protein
MSAADNVYKNMAVIIKYCNDNPGELELLLNLDYSKEQFGIAFSFFIDVHDIDESNSKTQSRRFLKSDVFTVGNRTLRVTSQWTYGNIIRFKQFLSGKGIEPLVSIEVDTRGTTRKTYKGGAAMVKLENKIGSFNKGLALILGKLAYHIAPDIVTHIVEQNKNDRDYFTKLFAGKIEAEQYLFSGSACVFPGVRRYVSNKKDVTRTYNEAYRAIVDDNGFPRHIWCYLLGGKGYSSPMYKKIGLDAFELAHIFAHKETEINDEKEFFKTIDKDLRPYGEFTSAANVVLLPRGTVRPTDNSTVVKSIFYKRYIDLYGEETLGGRRGFLQSRVPDWYSDIEWNAPLLPEDWKKNIDALLEYRKDKITSIMEKG